MIYCEPDPHKHRLLIPFRGPIKWAVVGVTGISSNVGFFVFTGTLVFIYSLLKIALSNPRLRP